MESKKKYRLLKLQYSMAFFTFYKSANRKLQIIINNILQFSDIYNACEIINIFFYIYITILQTLMGNFLKNVLDYK